MILEAHSGERKLVIFSPKNIFSTKDSTKTKFIFQFHLPRVRRIFVDFLLATDLLGRRMENFLSLRIFFSAKDSTKTIFHLPRVRRISVGFDKENGKFSSPNYVRNIQFSFQFHSLEARA